MSVNYSGSRNVFIHRSFFDNLARLSEFQHVLIKPLSRQLSKINKDKFFTFSSFVHDFSCAKCLIIHCFDLSILTFFGILLLCQGIEPNPGPPRDGITVTTQNCRGLTNPSKLISLLRKAYSSSNHEKILCLQETHYLNRFALDNYFQGSSVVDNGERGQRGTAILVPKQFNVSKSRVSGQGRWALAAINDQLQSDRPVVIASIYAPNCHRESLHYFENFFEVLDEFIEEVGASFEWPHIIIAGDFNFVFNVDRDSRNRQTSQNEATLAAMVGSQLEERELQDSAVFDTQDANRFTWRRADCCSRLDYIFMSTGLSCRLRKFQTEWHSFGSTYDHASVTIDLRNRSALPRGKSFPKLFKSDIMTANAIPWLTAQLNEAKLQIPTYWNPHQVHDFLKMTLCSKTLELRAMNKRVSSTSAIKDRINDCMRSPSPSDESIRLAEQLKVELLQAEEAEAEVLRLKAGIKWREQGERSTKYFLSRLKSRELARNMHSLLDSNGVRIEALQALLEHVKSFYSSLYRKVMTNPANDAGDFFSHCPTLDLVQQQQLSSPITIAELKESLKSCKDSAPGLDGIPYSFYATFGDILLPSLLHSWNYSLSKGHLSQSQSQACITLLPKQNKNLNLIQNWRPISLSPCDLKIITKAYAKRLSLILPNILSESQAAYVEGRDISFNNRLLRIAQKYSQEHNKDYCVISLDAKKAFDSVSHSYLVQVMKAYDFPVEFIHVFETLYSNNCALVQVNGHLSTPLRLERGVKQGDALSCGLFVLAIDPLLRNLVANNDIRGLHIPVEDHESLEVKVLAYADDVAVICKNRNLRPIFKEYERLTGLSGLELNADKTEIFNFIESYNTVSTVEYLGQAHNIGRLDSIKICGIHLSRVPDRDYQKNVMESITKMEKIVSAWKNRGLSLNGRMIAAKTFVLSQIVFQAQVLTIAAKEVKRIERLIYSFVNGAKSLYGPERIARNKLKATKERGGINGVDVDSFIKAIQIRQYSKALTKHRLLGTFQSSFKNCKDELSITVSSLLRLHYRNTLKEGIFDLQQIHQLSSIPLNLLICPGTRGYNHVSNLSVISLSDLQKEINNNRISRPHSNIVIKQLPVSMRMLLRTSSFVDTHPAIIVAMENDVFCSADQIKSTLLRRRLLEIKHGVFSVQAKVVYKQPLWQEPENWQHLLWKIKNPQLRGYRLKLLYKDVFSNERRHRFKLSESPNCSICGQVESVTHQILECANAQRLWAMYYRITGRPVRSMLEIITCTESIDIEMIKTIIIKRLIQIDRSAGVNLVAIKKEIVHYFRVEACSLSKSYQFWMQCINNVENA